LTAPHFCHTCGEEISTPFGRRRHTILHKCAGRPEAVQTGVYAAIYYCPHCHNPPTLLESPSHQWGQETACPVCAGRFLAPRDDVLHRRPGDVDPGGSFSFACPSCEERLECNALFKGQSVAGLSVVCPHCHHLLEIPSGGWR
jgi:DNA-directed RNA polymerase subunit RPC12/RpoP